MSLPTSRPRTYVNGDPLIPDDINELFDSVIASKRGAQWRFIPASAGSIVQGAVGADHSEHWSGAVFIGLAVGDRLSIPIELAEGERLLEARGYVTNGVGDEIEMELRYSQLLPVQSSGGLGGGPVTSTDHAFVMEALTVAGLTEQMSMTTLRSYRALFEVAAFADTPGVFGLAIQTVIL